MERRIVIILNPGREGEENYCQGVLRDAENYTSFFKSPYGGYWDANNEISVLTKPTEQEVIREMKRIASADYSIVVFCGHSEYSMQMQCNRLYLNDADETIPETKLYQNPTKRLVILDCCRGVVDDRQNICDSLRAGTEFFSATARHPDPALYRKYYNQKIEACENQLVVAYSAAIGESAGDDSQRGGVYSYLLLNYARTEIRNIERELSPNKYRTLSLAFIHEQIKNSVSKQSQMKQSPQIRKPRTVKNHLPFAIALS